MLPVYVSVTTSCRCSDWTQTAQNKWYSTVNTTVQETTCLPIYDSSLQGRFMQYKWS